MFKSGRPVNRWTMAASSLNKLNEFSESKLLKINGQIDSDSEQCKFVSVKFCDNGEILVADAGNNKLKLFQTDGRLLNVLDLESAPHSVEILDGKVAIVSIPDTKTVRVVSTKTNILIPQQDLTRKESAYWLARNRSFGLVQFGENGRVSLMEMHPEGRIKRYTRQFPFRAIRGMCFDPVEEIIYVIDEAVSAIQSINKGGEVVRSSPVKDYSRLGDFCRSEDGRYFYICTSFQVLKVSMEGKVVHTLSTNTIDPLSVSVNQNGTMLAVTGDSDTIHVYSRC